MGPETSSTIGKEKEQNWAFKIEEEDKFVEALLADQPFVPQYFPYDVEVNREGASAFRESLKNIPRLGTEEVDSSLPIVDVRSEDDFKQGHIAGAINIQENGKFETWLGSLIEPEKPFYLVVASEEQLDQALHRAAKIGYETHVKGVVIVHQPLAEKSPSLDVDHFKSKPEDYTIVDIRNTSETQGDKLFNNAVNIPLPELADRVSEVDASKPVVVHCAGGYRSAAGSSILEKELPEATVYDLSETVKEFQTQEA